MSFLLYGIVAEDGLAEGLADPLVSIPCAGLAAVAAACDHAGQELETVLAFGNVIERIHRRTTIIPVRYGTLLPDEAAVTERLSVAADHYRGLLAELEGCEEMGIRLPMAKPTIDSHPIRPAASGRDYLQSLRRKYSATEQAENAAAALDAALAGLYRKQRAEAGLFNGEPMYLASYLVPRDRLDAFLRKLDELADCGNFKGLISGPWPPYNFA